MGPVGFCYTESRQRPHLILVSIYRGSTHVQVRGQRFSRCPPYRSSGDKHLCPLNVLLALTLVVQSNWRLRAPEFIDQYPRLDSQLVVELSVPADPGTYFLQACMSFKVGEQPAPTQRKRGGRAGMLLTVRSRIRQALPGYTEPFDSSQPHTSHRSSQNRIGVFYKNSRLEM